MGFFDSPPRPVKIKLLNVENGGSNAVISYMAIYANKSTENFRVNVKLLKSSFYYLANPRMTKAECLGKVYIGILKTDVRLLFVVTLSDGTVDLIQEQEGTNRCNNVLALSMSEEYSEEVTTKAKAEPSTTAATNQWEHFETDLDIPIEILPNLYSLSTSNVSIKRRQTYENGIKKYDTLAFKCRVNYSLNGRKEGKRYIIITTYDEHGGVKDIRGEYDKHHFTAAGFEFIEWNFDNYDKYTISKIGISIKEV